MKLPPPKIMFLLDLSSSVKKTPFTIAFYIKNSIKITIAFYIKNSIKIKCNISIFRRKDFSQNFISAKIPQNLIFA